ncbi:hypothetical protein [Brachybacterium saurashtrense]|nr:hypothetical protein [Brachybacterium saurashtrense]
MNAQNGPSGQQPLRRGAASMRHGATSPRTAQEPWSRLPPPSPPPRSPLEGTIHAPRSKALRVPRRRGRWLTVGVPVVLAGMLGISSFLVLGVSSLVGGAGLLTPFLAGLGVAAVTGGGSAFLLRNRRPSPVAPPRGAPAEMPAGTRVLVEKVVKDSRRQQRRVQHLERRARGGAVTPILRRAETLLLRVEALMGSAALQSRRASDADVMMLEGMAERYLPELVDALEDTAGFLTPTTTESAREQALANLHSIDQQLAVLGGRLDRLEDDVVSGVTRSLDVHSEFLRARFSEDSADPLLES